MSEQLNPAEAALRELAADLVGQISAAQLELAREEVRQDLAVELASAPVQDPVMVQADPSGVPAATAPPPGWCDDPWCDHLSLRCPRNRTHLVGGHLANRMQLISRGSTRPPDGSRSARGRAR